MLDDDHTPSDTSGPTRGFTRGLIVGAYEGLRAGEAIVAVRGLGLRPCLERVEGYEASLHGFVVSQEPPSGVEVAADSQVFLYIAAPSRTVVEREVAPETGEVDAGEEAQAEAEPEVETEADAVAERYRPAVEESETAEFAAEGFAAEASDVEVEEPQIEVSDFAAETSEVEAFDVEGEASGVEESREQAPVWRGAVPGAVPRRRLGPRRSGRMRVWGSLPLGLRVALFAVVAVVVLALLVSLASSGQVGRGDFARRPSARSAAPSSRPRGTARGMPGAVVQAPRPGARQPVAPRMTFGRSPHPRVTRLPVPSSRATASSVVRGAVAGRAPAADGGGEISGAAAEEHAALEFGP